MKLNYKIIILVLVAAVLVAIFLLLQAPKKYQATVKSASDISTDYQAVAPSVPTTTPVSSTPVIIPKQTTLIFGGDVMLSRTVNSKMATYKNYKWPFEKISSVMSDADLSVINLESPITFSKNYSVPSGSFSFNADPKAVAGLKLAGIDLVTLANNHFANQGQKGMKDTFKILTENNIGYVGAGVDSKTAHDYKKININGLNFCFLGYAYPNDGSVAGVAKPGIATMNLSAMKKDVTGAKADCGKVIVMMHAGIEYVNKPNAEQKNFAHGAIDAGADLVIGHHPHWVQTTENYKGKPIIYSLGNLVFDQMWSRETQQGALAKVFFDGDHLDKIQIIPIQIKDYGQANLASTSTGQEILRRVGLVGSEIDF